MKQKLKTLISAFMVALVMGTPSQIAFAADSSSSSAESMTDYVAVSAEGEAAYMDGSSFALADFARFEKGSNHERGGRSIGYNYYEGSSADYAVAIAFADSVVVYIPQSAHALCDVSDQTSKDQLKAYFCALDAKNNKGGSDIASIDGWVYTADPEFSDGDVVCSFGVEGDSGKYYIGIMPSEEGQTDAEGVMLPADRLPTHVDIGKISEPDQVDIVMPSKGIAAFGEFLSGIDMSPLFVTLKTTGCAIVFIFILGLAAAYFTMRIPKRTQDIFDTIFTIPMVLPPTVCGFLLLLLFGRNTELGRWFIDIGFPLIFSWPATVIAATVVAFPLMYRSCRGAFENLDANMLDAARTLGWSNAKIFFKLMIPLSWSSIAAATVLAFARALGEFGATLFLAGNYVGITRTIPIAIYFEWMSGNMDVAIFWTVIILIFSFFVILFINLWSRRTTKYRRKEVE